MKARIFYGQSGRFGVKIENSLELVHTTIKGKRLQGVDDYNPLAPGDWIELDHNFLITKRLKRNNVLQRFNWKQNKPQTFCANVDLVLCVLAAKSPEFHVRFLDRLLVSAILGGVKPVIVINKIDEGIEHLEEIISLYQNLGYVLILSSAKKLIGIDVVLELAHHKVVALLGASGVGKSTLLNALEPNIMQITGEVNRKWNRGNHTTNFATILSKDSGGYWIDTPGMRDFTPYLLSKDELIYAFPEIISVQENCYFVNCQHIQEKECAVQQALADKKIAITRYQSYVKILQETSIYLNKR